VKPVSLEDALGISIFALVKPDHGVRSSDHGMPVVGDDLLACQLFSPCIKARILLVILPSGSFAP
jgi:hypothetical protein